AAPDGGRLMSAPTAVDLVRATRTRGARRANGVTIALAVVLAVLFVASLPLGDPVYPLGDVWSVVRGETVPGASFIVGELRLPRAVLAVLAGAAYGLAGITFQTMLRNPLA